MSGKIIQIPLRDNPVDAQTLAQNIEWIRIMLERFERDGYARTTDHTIMTRHLLAIMRRGEYDPADFRLGELDRIFPKLGRPSDPQSAAGGLHL